MADEIQFGADGATASDPDTARAQIEMTRARMSETIDEIEDALLRKKERIQNRLDVFAPVRERPFATLGMVLGAGLLLGLLTGGDDEDDRERYQEAEERAELWERRARRLLRIAREQEAELSALGGTERLGARHALPASRMDGDGEVDDAGMSGVRDVLVERMGGFLANTVRQLFGGDARAA